MPVSKNARRFAGAAAAVVAVAAVVWWFNRRPAEVGAIDLIETFPEAEKRTSVATLDQGFALEDVTIGGERKRCIYATPPSRIIWSVTIPDGARLETAFGMREDSWNKPASNGAQFRIGISDGRIYEEFLRQYVNPTGNPSDRRWHTVALDLSAYAGRRVQVIFNTDTGPPGDWNPAYDFSVWGEPRIVSSR
jgi:hypothetical protein